MVEKTVAELPATAAAELPTAEAEPALDETLVAAQGESGQQSAVQSEPEQQNAALSDAESEQDAPKAATEDSKSEQDESLQSENSPRAE